MSKEDIYYIPENIEGETFRYVADLVKDVLQETDILENIIQKSLVAYNRMLSEKCSSKSLQVMNQNHKLVFSTITSSGVIKSPRCASAGAKKDTKVPCIVNLQLSTPVKANRISSSKERKRLSFDFAENEHMKPVKSFTVDSEELEMRINTNSSFFENAGEANPHDNAEAIPEWFYTPVIDNKITDNPLTQTLYKDQAMNFSPFNTERTSINCNIEEERNAWYLQCRSSLFSLEKVPKAFDSPDKYVEERFNIEGKPETMTSRDIYNLDDAYMKRKTQDDQQAMVNSPGNQNSTLENYESSNESSDRCLPFRNPFTRSDKKVNVFGKNNENEQDSFNPDKIHERVSRLAVDSLKTSSISYKSPEKLQAVTDKANKEDRTPKNQIIVKKVNVIATNDKECSSPKKYAQTSDNQNGKKRKSVDDEEITTMITSLVTVDQEFKVPSKISKLYHDHTTNDEKVVSAGVSVMDDNYSFCSAHDSPMDTNNPFHSVDNSDMDDGNDINSKLNTEPLTDDEKDVILADASVVTGNSSICSIDESHIYANPTFHSTANCAGDCNDSFNRPQGDYLKDQEIAKPDDKSIRSADHTNNCKSMYVTPDKKSERLTYEASITQDCVSPFSTKATNAVECSSPMKDVKRPYNSNSEKQKSGDYSEEATMATSLVNEDQKSMIVSKTSKLNNELTANDEHVTISSDRSVINGNICSIDETTMDAKKTFHSADNCVMDCNDSFSRPDSDFMIDQNIAESDNEFILSAVHSINNCETPDKKSENPTYQTSKAQNCVPDFSPESDQKEIADEVKSDVRNSKCDKVKSVAHESKDVDSLTNLMRNLSPSEKRSSDDDMRNLKCEKVKNVSHAIKDVESLTNLMRNLSPSEKRSSDDDIRNLKCEKVKTAARESKEVESPTNLIQNLSPSEKRSSDDTSSKFKAQGSIGDSATSIEKLRLQDNESKTTTSPRECLNSKELSFLANYSYAIQAVKFLEYLKQRTARFSMYLHLFIEDQQDLTFICEYIEKLALVSEIQLSDNQLYINAVLDVINKARKLLVKGNSWLLKIMEDIKNWEDCIKKVNEIQQNVKQFCREARLDATPKDFKIWEARFKSVNKIADDMILLREIRRPSIIQFGFEIENLNQGFIQCMLAVGILKQFSKITSD